jgi:thiol-disulfide isomerase/thioredoxin
MAVSPRLRKFVKELLFFLAAFALISWGINAWRAPELPETTLPLLRGKTLQGVPLSRLHQEGAPFLIHFWGTWCPVCRQEASNIERIAKSFPLLTIAVRSGGDEELRRWMRERGLRYPVLNDPEGRLASRFGIGIYPTTLIYDGKGKLRFAETGYTTTLGLWLRLQWAKWRGTR